jgi:hypothetical protein
MEEDVAPDAGASDPVVRHSRSLGQLIDQEKAKTALPLGICRENVGFES